MAGDNAGILIRGVKKEDITVALAAVVRVTPHTEFEAEVYILSEGGRCLPSSSQVTPQFYIRTTDVTGEALKEC